MRGRGGCDRTGPCRQRDLRLPDDVGEIARTLGIPVPRLAVVDLPRDIARYEADEEVQDLLVASLGLNLGVDYLPGAFGFDGDVEAGQMAVARGRQRNIDGWVERRRAGTKTADAARDVAHASPRAAADEAASTSVDEESSADEGITK